MEAEREGVGVWRRRRVKGREGAYGGRTLVNDLSVVSVSFDALEAGDTVEGQFDFV